MTPDPAIVALREALEQRLDELADEATEEIVSEIPAYRSAGPQLRGDVREHVIAHMRASVASLGERAVTREDLLFVRPHAARRVRRVSLADFVHAFYIGERVLWDAVVALAEDDESRRAVLLFASHQPRYFEVATTHAAEVYLEAQEQLAVTGERIRRDLLENLLAGQAPEPGPRLDAARAAGLHDAATCLVISAVPSVSPAEEQLLRGAASSLARATGTGMPPLAVVRQDEIVLVLATDRAAAQTVKAGTEKALERLAAAGLPLVAGISTVVGGLAQIPDAYREATIVRVTRDSRPGVVSLAGMSAFDYLTLRPDPTARRLIAPAVHAFVAQDALEGAPLIATLREYVACDLNARRAAETLHVHVNTAHYRLARIAERTGCDLRRLDDLMEILIAARMADAAATVPTGV